LSLAYVSFGRLPAVEAALLGVKCAVVAIVLEALLRIARRALLSRGAWIVAGLALVSLHAFALPYPLLVALAALAGWWTARRRAGSISPVATTTVSRGHWLGLAALAAAWLVPLAALLFLRGPDDVLARIGLFYSELALVAFGGAYALLAYVADRAVTGYGWLSAAQMTDGLGLAETTPGPLILVLQFVAFVAAWQSGTPAPVALALVASLAAVWFLFVPSLLWVFAGAPWVERLTADPRLRGALSYVTAAVVGVIANLSLWFAAHVLFARVEWRHAGIARVLWPQWDALRPEALALAILAAVLLFVLRAGLLRTLLATAAAAVAWHALRA
jgi:chromate transporter